MMEPGKISSDEGVNIEDTTGCGLTYSQYTALYSKMLNSIKQNGGFWVGRYEVGIDEATVRSYGEDYTTLHPTTGYTPVIKENKHPYLWIRCSQAQELSQTFLGIDTTREHVSSLMFGIQWDLVLKHIETKYVQKAENKKEALSAIQTELRVNCISWGNYLDNTIYKITKKGAEYSTKFGREWSNDLPYQKNEQVSILLTTGASQMFSKMNIFDLAGNSYEYVLEYSADSSKPSVMRAGSYYNSGKAVTAHTRVNCNITSSTYTQGFRVSLY